MICDDAPIPFEVLVTEGDVTVTWWLGFLVATVDDLSQRTLSAYEAMAWLRSKRREPTSFISIVETFGADPDVIRREMCRHAHNALLAKINERETGWREIASWYRGETMMPYPASWLLELANLEGNAAIAEAVRVERSDIEDDNLNVARKAA